MNPQKYIGIAYSGSGIPLTRTPSSQVYVATPDRLPQRVNPPHSDFGSSLSVFLLDAVNEIEQLFRWLFTWLAKIGIDRAATSHSPRDVAGVSYPEDLP